MFAQDDTLEVVRLEQVKHDDRHLVVHAERERGGIHHLELLLQRFEIGDLRKTFGGRILFGVGIVNAVDLGGFEDHFGADFIGAQRGGGIG